MEVYIALDQEIVAHHKRLHQYQPSRLPPSISGEKQAPPLHVSFHIFQKTDFTWRDLILRNAPFSLPTTKEAWMTHSVTARYTDIINGSM